MPRITIPRVQFDRESKSHEIKRNYASVNLKLTFGISLPVDQGLPFYHFNMIRPSIWVRISPIMALSNKFLNLTIPDGQKRPIYPKIEVEKGTRHSVSQIRSENIFFKSITWLWIFTCRTLNITIKDENSITLQVPCKDEIDHL